MPARKPPMLSRRQETSKRSSQHEPTFREDKQDAVQARESQKFNRRHAEEERTRVLDPAPNHFRVPHGAKQEEISQVPDVNR